MKLYLILITVKFKMGNNKSQTQHQCMIVDHLQLGQIQIYKQKNCIRKIYNFADFYTFNDCYSRMQIRMKKFVNNPYLLPIRKIEKEQIKQLCSFGGIIMVQFENYQTDLNSVINQKKLQMTHFSQQEIVMFLKKIVEALLYLYDNGLKIGFLEPTSILLNQKQQQSYNNENINIKLVDSVFLGCNIYQKLFSILRIKNPRLNNEMQQFHNVYLSPQILHQLKNNNPDPYMSPKSDIFTIAMIILSMCSLQQLDPFYDLTTLTVDSESLIYKISKLIYSQKLKKILAQMLQEDPQQRIGMITLLEKINDNFKFTNKLKSRSNSAKLLNDLLSQSRRQQSTLPDDHIRGKCSSFKESKGISINGSNHSSRTSLLSRKKQSFKQKPIIFGQIHPFNTKQNTSNLLKNIVKKKTENPKILKSVNFFEKQNRPDNQSNQHMNYQPTSLTYLDKIRMLHNSGFQKKNVSNKMLADRNLNISGICNQTNQSQTHKRINISELSLSYEHESNFKIKFPQRKINVFERIHQNNQSQIIQNKNLYPNFKMNRVQFNDSLALSIEDVKLNNSKMMKPFEQFCCQQKSLPSINIKFDRLSNFCKEVKTLERQTPQNISKQPPITNYNFKRKQYKENAQQLNLSPNKNFQSAIKSAQSPQLSSGKMHSFLSSNSKCGKLQFENGQQYQGQILEGIINGNGILYDKFQRILYSGSWQNGQYHGFGTLNYYDLTQIDFQLKLDFRSSNEIKYEGQFHKGKRHGFGTIYYENKEKFSGCMKNNKASGYGCFYKYNGQMVSGIWQQNCYKRL